MLEALECYDSAFEASCNFAATSAGFGGSGTVGQDFFNASWSMTKVPFGPLTAPARMIVSIANPFLQKPSAGLTIHDHNSILRIRL
jgi:hypothetical protein